MSTMERRSLEISTRLTSECLSEFYDDERSCAQHIYGYGSHTLLNVFTEKFLPNAIDTIYSAVVELKVIADRDRRENLLTFVLHELEQLMLRYPVDVVFHDNSDVPWRRS